LPDFSIDGHTAKENPLIEANLISWKERDPEAFHGGGIGGIERRRVPGRISTVKDARSRPDIVFAATNTVFSGDHLIEAADVVGVIVGGEDSIQGREA
jgi:hypothetical protein